MGAYSRETYLAWLAAAGLTPNTISSLLEGNNQPEAVFQALIQGNEFDRLEMPRSALAFMRKNASDQVLSRWETLIQTHGIRGVTRWDQAYPERLRNLQDPPGILFYQGHMEALAGRTVAMVGSRNASWKGQEAARKTAQRLSENGIAVVSGLAYGIDTAAHQGCLKGFSPTIAVLGCGLDQQYPSENAPLRDQIIQQGGLILSEFAPGEKPLGWHFPFRNRIISGLGDCLALMEARIKSGSMTSVQHALDQGKDVFVYPGEPGNPRNEGNHQLLREGAIYFTTAEDLMEDMRWLDKNDDVMQNSGCAAPPQGLTQPEKLIYERLSSGELSFDQLCETLEMSAAHLNATLSLMQIKGVVEAMPGKLYRINQEN